MAFVDAVVSGTTMGNKKWKFGTFTQADTDTGGEIVTGLAAIDACGVVNTSHIGSKNPKFTISGGTITVITEPGVDGKWWACG